MDGNPDGYIIMPTTYEPKKNGPFNLSVSTDVEFELTSLENWDDIKGSQNKHSDKIKVI